MESQIIQISFSHFMFLLLFSPPSVSYVILYTSILIASAVKCNSGRLMLQTWNRKKHESWGVKNDKSPFPSALPPTFHKPRVTSVPVGIMADTSCPEKYQIPPKSPSIDLENIWIYTKYMEDNGSTSYVCVEFHCTYTVFWCMKMPLCFWM